MINAPMNICPRTSYLVRTYEPKVNMLPLSADDYMNVGYMAGRFGINLCNPNEFNTFISTPQGALVNINSCCSNLFEQNLAASGIRFDRLG